MTYQVLHESSASAQSTGRFAQMYPQVIERVTCQVPQIYVLEVSPHIFLRIDLRRIGREVLNNKPSNGVELAKFCQLGALVDSGTVPKQQNIPWNVRQQVTDELHGALGAY